MAKSLHAVMMPFPVKGSINPFNQLAHLLSARGFLITFVNTEWSHRRMLDDGGHADEPAAFSVGLSNGYCTREAMLGSMIVARV
ncbi:hypothetical protein SUGI_1098960 [Cryptomeria japonica]|nr:hypothetical protein SUGI_1098960 [Cryptomeria japonica]